MQSLSFFVNKVFYIEWPLDSILFHRTETVKKFVKGNKSYAFFTLAESQILPFLQFYENHCKWRVWIKFERRSKISNCIVFDLNAKY